MGPVYHISRNPQFPKIFLTVGDWTARVWSEDIKDASILSSQVILTISIGFGSNILFQAEQANVTDGCWSPTRPGVFFTTKTDGTLDVYDLMVRHSTPTLRVKVSDSLRCASVHNSGSLIATGAVNGETTLINLSESLYKVSSYFMIKSLSYGIYKNIRATNKKSRGVTCYLNEKVVARKSWRLVKEN